MGLICPWQWVSSGAVWRCDSVILGIMSSVWGEEILNLSLNQMTIEKQISMC